MLDRELMREAIKARELSHSPYSEFAVGAAVMTKDGRVFHGANIENASYGLSMCAERIALYCAYMAGCTKRDFKAMAIVADTRRECSPCGACRQVIAELFPEDAPIYMGNLDGDIEETTLEELLPHAFSEEDL